MFRQGIRHRASIKNEHNLVQMASRIHRVWASCCRQTLLCLQNHWCQGETGSIWWNTALVLPLPFSKCREAQKKELKRNWKSSVREGERARVMEEKERVSTRWIMQSCQRRLLLEVLAVLKGASPDLHKLHQPLSPLPMAESCLICAPANGQQHDEEEAIVGGHLVTGELSWRDTPATPSTLFITIIYRGHQQGDLSWCVQPPCGNIITEQRLSE